MKKLPSLTFGILTAGVFAYAFYRPGTKQIPYLSDGELLRSIVVAESTRPLMMKASLWGFALAKKLEIMPLLRPVIRPTFYSHFCGGENEGEVNGNVAAITQAGYKVCLGSAVEEGSGALEGIFRSIEMSGKGNFIFVKLSGLGDGLQALVSGRVENIEGQLRQICEAAKTHQVKVLVDAERADLQPVIDDMVLRVSREYNHDDALIYNTYQMYLLRSHEILSRHLAAAKSDGFKLGAKLVRGAYINSDPRELIWPTIEDTHAAYNQAITDLSKSATHSQVVVATHNKESIELAKQLDGPGAFTYAFLKGRGEDLAHDLRSENYNVVKYMPWGTVDECMYYLERRAVEFSGSDDKEGRAALWGEFRRRFRQKASSILVRSPEAVANI